ncbi:uncharacterized protein LOC125679473 [Ostrea edulis]|uniref:uncharacterized protein LOC125679473 n=1 Tax=Ostrea edulis TaxID=37623 RepID=UPI0024AF6969|nr:uncharacterized protein LOC125679473 [Ostrea edulis]
MAAANVLSSTPQKTYVLGNVCVICGFAFIQHLKNADGTITVTKYLDRKFKMSKERKETIEKVVGFEVKVDAESGVCQKCYRSAEKVIRMEKESTELRENLKKTTSTVQQTLLLSLPSPKRSIISKRMLRSPTVSQPAKKPVDPLFKISYIKPVTMNPFSDLTNLSNLSGQAHLPQIAAKPVAQSTPENESKPVTVRRSLGKTFETTVPLLQGEVEVHFFLTNSILTCQIRRE